MIGWWGKVEDRLLTNLSDCDVPFPWSIKWVHSPTTPQPYSFREFYSVDRRELGRGSLGEPEGDSKR